MRRAWLLLLLSACAGAPEHASDAGPGAELVSDAGEYVALAGDFGPYRSWTSFALDGGGQYPRIVYINAMPQAGDAHFTTGTIIVKEILDPTQPDGVEVDAMVKRGGSFNAAGAPGWEFFGLQRSGANVSIQWRSDGTSTPSSGNYGGGGVTCVGCHAQAAANDFVQTPALRLQ